MPGVPFIPGNEDCLFLNVWAPAARGRGGPSSGGTGISSRTGNAERAEAGVAGGEGGSTPRLPVMVWIHGGGYGLGDGTQDMSEFINANDNGFLVVSIQYRVG